MANRGIGKSADISSSSPVHPNHQTSWARRKGKSTTHSQHSEALFVEIQYRHTLAIDGFHSVIPYIFGSFHVVSADFSMKLFFPHAQEYVRISISIFSIRVAYCISVSERQTKLHNINNQTVVCVWTKLLSGTSLPYNINVLRIRGICRHSNKFYSVIKHSI